MDYTLLGVKFNVINVILCVALGFLICAMIGYNNNNIIEGAKRNSDPKWLSLSEPYKGVRHLLSTHTRKRLGKIRPWHFSDTNRHLK